MSEIRVVAVCVFRRGDRILVGRGYDAVKEEAFYRPLGGAVEPGETAAEALRREIREELRLEISEPVQLGVLESIFTFAGRPGHEYVVVFDATFVDRTLYDQDAVPVFEEVWGGEAQWLDLGQPLAAPVYPDGLMELLRAHEGGHPDGEQRSPHPPVGPGSRSGAPRSPAVGVGCIVMRDGRTLMVRSHSGRWSTPGGHLDFGESPAECAVRETLEETGIVVGEPEHVAITNDVLDDVGRHYVTIWMRADAADGDIAIADTGEIAEAGWFAPDRLPEPRHLFFENLLAGRSLPPRPPNNPFRT